MAAVIVAAGAYALTRDAPAPEAPHPVATPAQDPVDDPASPDDPNPPDLAPDDEPAAIQWSVPAGWRTVPSPSSMRLATYLVARAAGDAADADVSVSRAGGDESTNIERWVGQFEGAGAPKRRTQKVRGIDVTVVEIEGTYTNAMQPEAPPRPGWALLGAIVKSRGQPYFFKMTGPAATVHAARASFEKLVESLEPAE